MILVIVLAVLFTLLMTYLLCRKNEEFSENNNRIFLDCSTCIEKSKACLEKPTKKCVDDVKKYVPLGCDVERETQFENIQDQIKALNL